MFLLFNSIKHVQTQNSVHSLSGGRIRRTWLWSSPWRFTVELLCVLTRLLSFCCRRMWFCWFTCSAAHTSSDLLSQQPGRAAAGRRQADYWPTQSADTDWSTGSSSSIQPRCKTDPTTEKWWKALVMYLVIVSHHLNPLWWIKVFTDKAGRQESSSDLNKSLLYSIDLMQPDINRSILWYV